MKTGCFTICSRNYLAYALSLRDSLLAHEPNLAFRIYLADAPLEESAPEGIEIISVSKVIGKKLNDLAFRYNVVEFNTAIKPFCFEHMFDTAGFDAAIYIDPDIHLYAPLHAVHTALAEGASSVLTPHICAPLEDSETPSDIDLMRSGTFNLGFAAFANTAEARRFIHWWRDKLCDHCKVDLPNGLFVDQRFVDFAPSFIEKLKILHHRGYNVAYWNLANRPIRKDGEGWFADKDPLVFFHFSGVDAKAPDVFSKHQSRFDMHNIGQAAELVRDYTSKLLANDFSSWSKIPYAYASFRTGEKILDPMRSGPPADAKDPFRCANHAYWGARSERVDQSEDAPISRLMFAIHASRPDLQRAHPLSTITGRRDFHDWFLVHAPSEYGIGRQHIPKFRTGGTLKLHSLSRHYSRVRLKFSDLRQKANKE